MKQKLVQKISSTAAITLQCVSTIIWINIREMASPPPPPRGGSP